MSVQQSQVISGVDLVQSNLNFSRVQLSSKHGKRKSIMQNLKESSTQQQRRPSTKGGKVDIDENPFTKESQFQTQNTYMSNSFAVKPLTLETEERSS